MIDNRMILMLSIKRVMTRTGLSLFIIGLIYISCYAQGEQIASSTDKKSIFLQLMFYNQPDTGRTAVVTVIERIENIGVVPVQGIIVNFYVLGTDSLILLQRIPTDEMGQARIRMSRSLPENKDGYITIIAKIPDNVSYESAEIGGSVKEANIVLEMTQVDTIQIINARVTQINANGTIMPVGDVDVTFYVRRLFGLLPLGSYSTVTTDEEGTASIALPNNIVGDVEGNVVIVARIEYNDTYGNVEAEKTVQFGIPLIPDENPFPRAMWERRAPIWMLLGFYFVLLGVLVMLFYLIYQLYMIKKENAAQTENE